MARRRRAALALAVLALLAALMALPLVPLLFDGAASQVPTDGVLPASHEVAAPSGLRHRVDVYLTATRWWIPGDEAELVVRSTLVNRSDSALAVERLCRWGLRGSLPLRSHPQAPRCVSLAERLAPGDSAVGEVYGAVRAPPGRYTLVVVAATSPAPEGVVEVQVVERQP